MNELKTERNHLKEDLDDLLEAASFVDSYNHLTENLQDLHFDELDVMAEDIQKELNAVLSTDENIENVKVESFLDTDQEEIGFIITADLVDLYDDEGVFDTIIDTLIDSDLEEELDGLTIKIALQSCTVVGRLANRDFEFIREESVRDCN